VRAHASPGDDLSLECKVEGAYVWSLIFLWQVGGEVTSEVKGKTDSKCDLLVPIENI
jgi:hypothetical protein